MYYTLKSTIGIQSGCHSWMHWLTNHFLYAHNDSYGTYVAGYSPTMYSTSDIVLIGSACCTLLAIVHRSELKRSLTAKRHWSWLGMGWDLTRRTFWASLTPTWSCPERIQMGPSPKCTVLKWVFNTQSKNLTSNMASLCESCMTHYYPKERSTVSPIYAKDVRVPALF